MNETFDIFNDFFKSLFSYQIVITPKSITFITVLVMILLVISVRSLKKIRVLNHEYLKEVHHEAPRGHKRTNSKTYPVEASSSDSNEEVTEDEEEEEEEEEDVVEQRRKRRDRRKNKISRDSIDNSNSSNSSINNTSPKSKPVTFNINGSINGSFSFSETQRRQVIETMKIQNILKKRKDILKAPMLEELDKTKKLNEPPQFKRTPPIRPNIYSTTSTALFKDINNPSQHANSNQLNSSTVSNIRTSNISQQFPNVKVDTKNYIPSNLYNYKDTSGSTSSQDKIELVEEKPVVHEPKSPLLPLTSILKHTSPIIKKLKEQGQQLQNNYDQDDENENSKQQNGDEDDEENGSSSTPKKGDRKSNLLTSNYQESENLANISLRFASNSISINKDTEGGSSATSEQTEENLSDYQSSSIPTKLMSSYDNNITPPPNPNNSNNNNTSNNIDFKDEIDELYNQSKQSKKTVTISSLNSLHSPSSSIHNHTSIESLKTNQSVSEQEDDEDYLGSDIDGEDFSSVNIDYNERFQEIMEDLRNIDCNSYQVDKIRVNSQFIALTQDFVYASSTFGKVIISERYLPNNEKTIPPIDIGGLAGGDKFIVHGILFKFAIDKENFYGSDYASMCVGGHELKGLINVFNCNVSNLSLPLMALVDYRGFRVIAMSILPIDKDSIYYGSNDYGLTIHNKDPYLSEKVKEVSTLLNIKSHNCGESGTFLHSPADLEGHRGFDGRYYLLDFARLFPAEAPRKSIKMGHLYRLLRPEFTRNFKKPLCSDAFSRFIRGHNEEEHNVEVVEATEYLLNTTIYEVADELNKLEIDINNVYNIPLTERLHKSGINVRYLGHVRQHCNSLDMKSLIFIEMCARVVKQQLRQKLRSKMAKAKIPLEAPYRRLIIAYLNRILGISDRSDLFWNERMKKYLMKKFDKSLFQDEIEGNTLILATSSFSDHMIDGKYLLFKRIQKMTGLKFTNRINEEFFSRPNCWLQRGEYPLDINDLDEIGIRVKYVPFMNVAQGYLFKVKGEMLFASDPVAAKRFFHMSLERLSTALETDPNNANTLCTMAEVWSHLGFGYEQGLSEIQLSKNNEYISKAYDYFQRAIFSNPNHTDSLFRFAQLLERCGEYDMAEDYYLSSLLTNSNNIACLQEYGNFLQTARNEAKVAESFFLRGSQNHHYLFKQREEQEDRNRINIRSSSGLLKVKQSSTNNIFDFMHSSSNSSNSSNSINSYGNSSFDRMPPTPTSPRSNLTQSKIL
ncbi:Histidine kinase A [Tieghemostelium lacteum]|uniref:Histidine kinase A n=1 Tax=Tieghemostelium lacteum TaxID=361077 RepID=A0A151ZHK2_TIELA|nr:Histidine kinase A [Tieghemostelium lacteum]|eukprot:KYQ93360.1 Histidine kinase A [Tieghemostelium lacteum]